MYTFGIWFLLSLATFGISESSMTVHDCLVKLIGKNLTILINQHIADHAKPINQWIE